MSGPHDIQDNQDLREEGARDEGRRVDLLSHDSELRRRFRQGDPQAMDIVYRSYLPLVQTICARGFGGFRGFFDPHDLDDAVQSTFLAAFEERARLQWDGVKPYSAWLQGITRNTIRKMLERRTRYERKDAGGESSSPPEQEQRAIEAETASLLSRFRASITEPRERTILEAYFVEGLSEEALAARLGLTRYRTRKIVKRLHKRMTVYARRHGLG